MTGACTDSRWQLSLQLLTEYVEQSIRTDIVVACFNNATPLKITPLKINMLHIIMEVDGSDHVPFYIYIYRWVICTVGEPAVHLPGCNKEP